MSKPCRCGGTKIDATYVLEVELDATPFYSEPAPAQQCEQCGETSIRMLELGRCEQQVALAAMQHDHTPSGHTIRYARRSIGLSHEALAVRLNVDVAVLKMWEMEQLALPKNHQTTMVEILTEELA